MPAHCRETINPNFEMELEAMVDRHGVSAILNGLANICAAKSEHISTNWQDASLAKLWDKDSRTLARAEVRITKY
jgi:hypothetical protein